MRGPYWRAAFVASSLPHACCGDNSHFVSSASHLLAGFRGSLILVLFFHFSCLVNGLHGVRRVTRYHILPEVRVLRHRK